MTGAKPATLDYAGCRRECAKRDDCRFVVTFHRVQCKLYTACRDGPMQHEVNKRFYKAAGQQPTVTHAAGNPSTDGT